MKLLTTIAILIVTLTASAQATLPVDKATGKVTYRFSIPVSNVTSEQAYELAQNWFATHRSECNRTNNNARTEGNDLNVKSRAEVATVFANATPLQSLDPYSNRMTAKMITKYVGDNGGTIHAMYLQYVLIVSISDGQINCEISDMRYNHFNRHSYRFQRVLNWGNASSLEPVDKIEYLMQNEQSHEEFSKFYSFLNNDINQFFGNIAGYVKSSSSVTMK